MHNLLAGLMGILASFSSFFHGGQPAGQPMMNTVTHSATVSGTITQGVGRGDGRAGMMNQNGERPFFGTVTGVNGSTITVEMQRPLMMMRQANPSNTPTITPPAPRTVTVTVDSATTYAGGTLTDIKTGIKIAGVGKASSDTAITAVKITINPTMPIGFPNGMPRGRGMHPSEPQGNNDNYGSTPQ